MAGFLPACSDKGEAVTPAPTAANANVVQMGLVLSLSGDFSSIGSEAKRGAEVAVAQINALGGILGGRQIQLVTVDDRSDPKQTRARVEELAANGVVAAVGPSTSQAALELKDLIVSDKILYVSPSATSPLLDHINDGVTAAPNTRAPVLFRTAATDAFLAAALSQWSSDSINNTRRCPYLALVVQNDSYGSPIAEQLTLAYTRLHVQVKQTITLDAATANSQTLASAAAQVGALAMPTQTNAVQCQVVVAQPTLAADYIRAFKDYTGKDTQRGGWTDFVTLGSDGFRQNDFLSASRADPADKASPTAAEGSFSAAADTVPPKRDDFSVSQEFAAFNNLFAAQFPGLDLGRYSSTAYDATVMLAMAMERAQTSSDVKQLREALFQLSGTGQTVTPAKMGDMLERVRRTPTLNYQGVSGSLDFQDNGSVRSDFSVWRVQGGVFTLVSTLSESVLSTSN
ncbi:Branched-chain amino acid ABC transporter, amino acid-binding protein [Labilithrix luteola]|uniref:Branched-chain amino acid ABC transporter, amino acid-binding protein n=1 Tax=Labilithrix luteola TaxID=1391654 RepID=A0A0K1QB81_9BACT|nr:Branched-chain amino acid ABC transporter, amino acid-binding protein [Labilithrix luteola]